MAAPSPADPVPSASPTESEDGSGAEPNGNQFINPDAPMPEASGLFGVDAALTFPSEDPSAELVVEVLIGETGRNSLPETLQFPLPGPGGAERFSTRV